MLKDTVRRLRKAKGLTQKQVAERIGVSAAAVTQWETGGGIDMPNLKKLAKALEIPAKVLIDEEEADRSINSRPDGQLTNDTLPQNGNNTHVGKGTPHNQEAVDMGEDDGAGDLKNAVLKDILARIQRLEGKVLDSEQGAPVTAARPQKRRRV
jgi:transcriptional regulator with XRE-family HTH domain